MQPQLELDAAIERSQGYLLSQQKPEGYWVGELMVDATLVADMVAYHHWNGKVDPEWQRKAVNHIFSHAAARRRLEHLLRRPGGGERHHQGLPGAQAGRRARHRSPHAARARNGPEPRRRAADEHLLQALPRAARPVPLGLRAHHPLRGHPDRQMVPRELQRDELLDPLHARAAGHHQPFQTHPPAQEADQPRRALPRGHPRTRPGPRPRPGAPHLAQLLPLARPPAQVRRVVRPTRHPPVPQARPASKAEQWMLERFEGSDGLAAIFPAMLNSLIALKALGYPDDHPQVAARRTRTQEARARDRATASASNPVSRRSGTPPSSTICLRESGVPADHPALEAAPPSG